MHGGNNEDGSVSEAELALAERRGGIRARSLGSIDPDELEWPSGPGPDTSLCFGEVRSRTRVDNFCTRFAGAGTDHPGVGYCSSHGGRTPAGIREAAWAVGHKFGQALDVTPWQGLLWAVKIAAGKVAFIEAKLGEARSDEQFKPPREQDTTPTSADAMTVVYGEENLNWWVKQSELWHDKLTRVSKLAIDAGVAERLVRQLELEAQLMLKATNRMLDDLGLEGEVREKALISMSSHLLDVEAEEGELVERAS